MMKNQVDVIHTGYSHQDPLYSFNSRANCTVTLIRLLSGRNVIVDTMTAWDGDKMVELLHQYNVKVSDINTVVCTHGHSDHTGCNYLFTQAERHIVGNDMSTHTKYFDWFPDHLNPFLLDDDEDCAILCTPGHTLDSVSVIVRNTQLGAVVGVCGDLFERMEDIAEPELWLGARSQNPDEQRRHRLRMAEMCSYIIPGHGKGFDVTDKMREQLQKQLDEG